ncbi:MAG TPA: hypothetical protein VJY62_15985 [Bacteroidia bacterium]|nr:hypothetical protein [Bacteroidia bacterium]
MWEYLDAVGVLEKGTDEEIKAAKKAYRKKYFLEYKQKQRSNKPEYTINFKKENGEHGRISLAAKQHKMTVTSFIRSAVLAYLNRTYIVPDRLQIARLEQLLSDCLNEIKSIIKPKERYFWEQEQRIELIEKRIQNLEAQVNDIFRYPPLMQNDYQNQIA